MSVERHILYKSKVLRGLGAATLAFNSACGLIDIQVRIGSQSPQAVTCSAPPDNLPGQDYGDSSLFPRGSKFTPEFLENDKNIKMLMEASTRLPVVLVEPPIFQDTEIRDLPIAMQERLGIQSVIFTAAPDGALGVLFEFGDNVCFGPEFQKPSTPVPLYVVVLKDGRYQRFYSTRQYGSSAHLEGDMRTKLSVFYADFWDTSLSDDISGQSLLLVLQRRLFSTSPDNPEVLPVVFRFVGRNQKL